MTPNLESGAGRQPFEQAPDPAEPKPEPVVFDTSRLDWIPKAVHRAFREAERRRAEIEKKADRKAIDASPQAAAKHHAKLAEVADALHEELATVEIKFNNIGEAVIGAGTLSGEDAGQPRDAAHVQQIQGLVNQFPQLTPTVAAATVRREIIAPRDAAAARAMLPAVDTALELGSTGKRPYYTDSIGELRALKRELEEVAETPAMRRRRIGMEVVSQRREGLRQFANLLRRCGSADPILPQLADQALGFVGGFSGLEWLRE